MDCKTQKGLYFLIIGLIIGMIYGFIISVVTFIIQDTTARTIIGFAALIAFIGSILILVGAVYFYIGRKEFGEKHENNVKKVLIIFCINIIISVVFVVAISYFVYAAISSSSIGDFATDPLILLFIIITTTSAILGGLMYYFGLIELENETGKNILFAGIISSVIISIITSFYVAGMLGELFGSISSINSYSSLSFNQNVGGIGILGVIPSLLYLYAFYIPYKRIKDGELIPQVITSGVPSRVCPNCGRPIPEDAGICPYCGKKFW